VTTNPGPASTPTSPQPMSPDELVKQYVELWKKTVEVQQHFNDLEWRIRGLALTAATFALGAAGVAAKDGTAYYGFSLGAMILLVGLILWYGFYFADRYWYHPLLIGSVKHGSKLENELKKYLPEAGLTDAISDESPQTPSKVEFWAPRKKATGKMHSTDKLNGFYIIGAVALVLTAAALEVLAFIPKESTPKVQRIEVIKPTTTNPQTSTPSSTTITPPISPTPSTSISPAPGPGSTVGTTSPSRPGS
jgi:hypothetical protein